jgi:hypothetical protein
MNKISYPQLVKDIADAYRNAIGSTDPITIGELANKVGETISRGNSIHYKSITYNKDNTITLIDNNDIEHTISCIYEDEKIVSIVLDSEEIKLSYDGDKLITVEDTVVNFDSILGDAADNTLNLFDGWTTTNSKCITNFYDDYVYFEYTSTYPSWDYFNIPLIKDHKTIVSLTVSNINTEGYFSFSFTNDYFSEAVTIKNNNTYTVELPSVPIDTVFDIKISNNSYNSSKNYFVLEDCYITYVPNDGDTSNVGNGSSNISNIGDFQNGFIVGLTSKGKTIQKTMSIKSGVIEVISPVNVEPIAAEINNSSVQIETSVAIEIVESEEQI